jgi:hypothetical protein
MAAQTQIIAALTGAGVSGSAWTGPLVSGPRSGQDAAGRGANQNLSVGMQQLTLVNNGNTAVSGTLWVPKHSVITQITALQTAPWNPVTSAVLTVGTAAADTTYLSGVDLKTGTFLEMPYSSAVPTAAQLGAWLDTGSNEQVTFTVTPNGGSLTTGQSTFFLCYAQTVNYQNP